MKKLFLGIILCGVFFSMSKGVNVEAASIDSTLVGEDFMELVLTEENAGDVGVVYLDEKNITLEDGTVVTVEESLNKISNNAIGMREVVDTARCIVGSGTYEHSYTVKVPGTFPFNLKSTTTYSVSTSGKSVKVIANNTAGTSGVGYSINATHSFTSNFVQNDYSVNAILFPGVSTYSMTKNFSVQGMSGSNLIVKIVTNFYK